MIMRTQILIVAFLLAIGIDASAQEVAGTIYGRIVDPTNAPLPGVSITVEGDAIQSLKTAESEANGSYRFPFLPPGEYRITYQKSGFKKLAYEGAKVELGKTLPMNVTMRIADIEETVVVTSRAPLVDLRNATVGTNFGATFLSDIPNQRDIFALLAMTPGITMPRPDVGGNTAGTQSAYRTYGLSGQSKWFVDGVDISGGADGVYIDYGALAEAKVSAAANSAEVAVAGAAVTTVIKSGSNTQHGEFFTEVKPGGNKDYPRPPFDPGAAPLEPQRPQKFLKYRDINAQLGGPFIKNRLWFFLSFRDHSTGFLSPMYSSPPDQGGIRGMPVSTATSDYTIKLNYKLSRTSTLAFVTQVGRKDQPYWGGSGANAHQYTVEATAIQDMWTEIGKVEYMRVLNNRATLDTSVNVFASQLPLTAHTDKTPIVDDATDIWSGAYKRPIYTDGRRWHYNTNLTLYADRHDMKIGYMYQRYGPQVTEYGAPGPAGTFGHFYILKTGGVPSAFWTDNGPVSNVNVLKNHALFFQDKFQVMSRLTLNYGIRFDQYRSSYPEQRFGLNGNRPCVDEHQCDVGPFAVSAVTPARDVVTFNTVVPRVALIFDLFGNSKTALKASWGRYSTNPAEGLADLVNPVDLILTKYAWDTSYLTWDLEVAATRITPAYVAARKPIDGGSQLTPATVDPNLKDSYIDEYTFGVDQEIAGDLRGYFNFVRKQGKNTFGTYDRLRTASAYAPVQAVDPGPDGLVGSDDDRTISVYETDVTPGTTDLYLTNKPIGDTYTTFEFGVMKRMRDRWQLASGFDWTKRDLSSLFSENPNTVFWGSNNTLTTGWTVKASGSYLFNRGVMVALSYNAMKGEPYGRNFSVRQSHLTLADPNRTTPLVQGTINIVAEEVGTYYLPAIHLINMRVQKAFVITQTQRLHLMVNIFNLNGVTTVTSVNTATGTSFRNPLARLAGTVVRIGTRYTF
jgi:hypothetical protein